MSVRFALVVFSPCSNNRGLVPSREKAFDELVNNHEKQHRAAPAEVDLKKRAAVFIHTDIELQRDL